MAPVSDAHLVSARLTLSDPTVSYSSITIELTAPVREVLEEYNTAALTFSPYAQRSVAYYRLLTQCTHIAGQQGLLTEVQVFHRLQHITDILEKLKKKELVGEHD